MAQTALQELIKHLERYEEVLGVTATFVKGKAQSLLPKERQDIIDGFDKGSEQILGQRITNIYGEDYFTQTFKQK